MSDEIILTYFDLAGRAEAARLCFHLGGVVFKDERLSKEEFVKAKAEGKFKYNQLPVLTVNGIQYAQSGAIIRYAAQKAGLYPKDDVQILKLEQVLNSYPEIFDKIAATFYMQDEEAKKAARIELSNNLIPVWLERLNKLLQENGNGYFVGDSLTLADIVSYVSIGALKSGFFDNIPKDISSKYVDLEKNFLLVYQNEKVQAWNAAHQKK